MEKDRRSQKRGQTELGGNEFMRERPMKKGNERRGKRPYENIKKKGILGGGGGGLKSNGKLQGKGDGQGIFGGF